MDIMCRFWSFEQIINTFPRTDLHLMRVKVYDEIMKLLYGTDDMVKIGLDTGLLKEYPKQTQKKEIKKTEKEIKEFFGGQSKKNKKGLSKKRNRHKDPSKVSSKKKP